MAQSNMAQTQAIPVVEKSMSVAMPWAQRLVMGTKKIENRTKNTLDCLKGKWVAIQVTKQCNAKWIKCQTKEYHNDRKKARRVEKHFGGFLIGII